MTSCEVFVLQGHMLTTLFMEYKRSLEVDAALDGARCIACDRTENLFSTDGGQTVYERTGVCETCRDILQNPLSTDKQKRTQCVSLTDAGCELAQQWILYSAEKRRLKFYSAVEFHEAESIALGRQRLPVSRR